MAKLRGYLWRFRAGDPVAKVCNTEHHNRVAAILENLEGMGCRIEKPTNGSAWRIIVDGTSDIEPPADYVSPFAGGYPWGTEYTFGLERTAPNKIKIYNGKARRQNDPQGTSLYYEAPTTEVTFAGNGDGQRIVWKWSIDSGLEINAAPQTNDPMNDSTYIYGVIAVFNVTSGTAALADYQQCGIIVLPVFAPA